MFKNPFSFKGRIRRTEYGLSLLIAAAGNIITLGFGAFITVPFMLAQVAKRSHDIGNSGWFILIPIYNPFFLLFTDGEKKNNQYGGNPKLLDGQISTYSDNQNSNINYTTSTIPDFCPHCKNPNTRRIRLCEWCGNQIC